jgi:hypothetical protein
VGQLRERTLQRWLHEMDGAASMQFVHNALNLGKQGEGGVCV